MTPEEALNNIAIYSSMHNGVLDESVKVFAKSVKALEIIKSKLPFYITEIQGYKYLAIKQGDIRRSDVLITITDEEYNVLKELLKNSMEV